MTQEALKLALEALNSGKPAIEAAHGIGVKP